MTGLRLLADDLTGALDTAAQFVGQTGPVMVYWDAVPTPLPPNVAVDCATREAGAGEAVAMTARWAETLGLDTAGFAYLKLDSLLRGHAGLEIASSLTAGRFRHCVIAPAFPFQGRVTRSGRQWAHLDGAWQLVGEDIAATFAHLGRAVTRADPGDPTPPGISLWNAETDADLRAIVAAGRSAGSRILWCGSGGLAGAIAGEPGDPDCDGITLSGPILGLFGTDHPVTGAQLAHAGAAVLRLPDGDAPSVDRVRRQLADQGAALVVVDLPPGLPRATAAARIDRAMADLTRRLEPPASLIAGGGETLRALCRSLGTRSIEVTGQVMPGVPRARLHGGRWDGVELISKSGAFGDVDLLHRLVTRTAQPRPAEASAPTTASLIQGSAT